VLKEYYDHFTKQGINQWGEESILMGQIPPLEQYFGGCRLFMFHIDKPRNLV